MQATASERLFPINFLFFVPLWPYGPGWTCQSPWRFSLGLFRFCFSFCGRERQSQRSLACASPFFFRGTTVHVHFLLSGANGPGQRLRARASLYQTSKTNWGGGGGRREGRRGEEPCVGGKRGRERSRCLTCWRPGTRTCMYVWSMPGHVDGHGGSEAGISAAGAPSSRRVGPVRRCETRFSATRAQRRV